jgi:hypothetical protein
MSFGWSLMRDSGYLATTSSQNVATGSLMVYVSGFNSRSYNGVGSTWNDLSGNGNNMTISNATWNAATKSFGFNGTNSIIYTPDLYTQFVTSNSAFNQTQEVWFKTSSSNGVIMCESNNLALNSWHDSQIELVGGSVKLRVWNLPSPYLTAGTNDSSRWNYVALRYNGATTTVDGYYNGVAITPQTYTRQFGPSPASYLAILGQADITNMGSGAYYNGNIAIYRNYKRALTNAEILSNFNAERGLFGV